MICGTNVPGINVRNFQATVELREGQALEVSLQNVIGCASLHALKSLFFVSR